MSARRRAATTRYVVAAADEIGPGERKIVIVAGRSIGVFNVGGEYFALRNRCPHQGGALCEGQLWGVLQSERPGEFAYRPSREVIACPWHGWEFHLRTGQSWCAPERLRARRYAVDLVAGADLQGDPPARVHSRQVAERSRAGRLVPVAASARTAATERECDPPVPGMVKGPYVAETYPVARDGAYLVVELPTDKHPGRSAPGAPGRMVHHRAAR